MKQSGETVTSREERHVDTALPHHLLPELVATLLSHTPAAIALLDGDELRVRYINARFNALLPEPLHRNGGSGPRLADLLPGCDEAGVCALAREARHSGQHLRRDGMNVHLHGEQTACWNVMLAPIGTAGASLIMLQVEDITAQVHAATDHARLTNDAFDQIKDDFLAITAHELRTPVTALLGYTNLMVRRAERGDWTDRDLHALRMIQAQTQRLTQLINGLVDVARIQAGVIELRSQEVDLVALARQVIGETRATIGDQQLVFEAPEEPVVVWGDPQRLEQVVSHLVDNALKYSPWGGTVRVRLWLDDHIHLAVMDRGMGIPEEALPHLFQRFYRAANVDSDRISGLGIGLFLVKEFITAHNGRIEARSTPEDGTTFEVVLPRSSSLVAQA